MMENSPDPGETEEEEEEESRISSPKTNPSLLEEIRMLSQANNNNCSYEGHTSSLISSWLCTIKKTFSRFKSNEPSPVCVHSMSLASDKAGFISLLYEICRFV